MSHEKVLFEKYLAAMKECAGNTGDPEMQHGQADDLLCELLSDLGYDAIVKEWQKVEKWYA